MNHLPLLIVVVALIVVGILLVAGGRDEDEAEPRPPTPPGGAVPPPHVPPPPAPEADAEDAASATELEPPPEELGPDGKVDLALRIEKYAVNDVSLAGALEDLGRLLGCDVSFSDGAWERVDHSSSVHLRLSDVSATTILHLLTEPYGIVYKVRGGVLWILMAGEEPPETAR